MRKSTVVFALALVIGALALVSAPRMARGTPAPPNQGGTVILTTALDDIALGTTWRYFETWQSDVIRLEDKSLLTVDIFADKAKAGSVPPVKKADRVLGSPFPPPTWRQVDFDDSSWVRQRGLFPNVYRSLAQVCLRGKFQAPDPSRVKELKLTVKFQGGAIAYVNGKEVGRAGLPSGPITDQTLADDYPHETFVDAQNKLFYEPFEYGRPTPLGSSDPRGAVAMRNADNAKRLQQRARTLEVTIPPGALNRGLNVLAIEVHRAPGEAVSFTAAEMWLGHYYQPTGLWNRAQFESVELQAAAAQGAIVPNIERPDGLQVWDEDVFTPIQAPTIGIMRYADPNEPPSCIRLHGVRNGATSGQIVVGSRRALRGLKAVATPLTGDGGGTIPLTALEVGYLDIATGALESTPPPEKTPPQQLGRIAVKNLNKALGDAIGVIQPVWLTVKVPRDTKAGVYSGTLTITAQGERTIAVPVQLKITGDWVAPDPADFQTWVVAHESPDSVAMQYNVPLWSEEHWKHLDKVYTLLGQIGVKDIHLPLITKTHLANEQSMVRWIKKPDGSYDHDFTVFDRYLDLAAKHLGKVQIVCIYLHDFGFRIEQAHDDAHKAPVVVHCTALDKATGQVSEFEPPAWGTPEARAFWKPVIEKIRGRLAQRGLEKAMMFGIAANNSALPECVSDLKTLAPDVLWVNRTHFYMPTVGVGSAKQKVGFTANVGAAIGVYWDPEAGAGHYAWRDPPRVVHFPRQGNVYGAVFENCLAPYRLFAEGVQLTHGQIGKSYSSVNGVGHIGADFWPVLKDARGGAKSMGDRYVFWHSLSLSEVIPYILAPGATTAAPCPRLELMREALQEAEARIFVQDALLDKDKAAKLGADLAKRCNDVCNERTQWFRYISAFCGLGAREDYFRVCSKRVWEENSQKLYQAASDVAKALGK